MTSPVGHSLGAYIANGGRYPAISPGQGLEPKAVIASLAWLVFAANAPDLDFVWGAWMGDMNTYHHGPSHSITAIFIFAALLWLVLPLLKQSRRLALTGALAYGSHLLLDMFTADRTPPFGMQLLWPFDTQYWLASQVYFLNIEHGNMGSTVLASLPAIFSAHNLTAIGFELLVLGPPALLIFVFRYMRVQQIPPAFD